MKVSSGIYQSVLGYADSITAASSAQSEMTGAPNKRQTSPDSGAQTAPTTHPAHERLSFEHPFSNSSFRTAFFQAPAPSSVPSRVPPLSALLRAIPLERSSFERPPSSVPPSIVRAYNTRFFAKYARIFRKARLRIREQFSLRSMIRASPDSLHALNGVFLQYNKPFSLHATLCLLFSFRILPLKPAHSPVSVTGLLLKPPQSSRRTSNFPEEHSQFHFRPYSQSYSPSYSLSYS